jgi:hypothetical protein
VIIALIIWHSPQIGGCSNALEKSLESSVFKRLHEGFMKSCILKIFLFFFIFFVLVGHRCALVHF